VYCEILPWDVTNDDVRKWKPKGIILSGGPESVTDKEPPRAPQAVFELGVPVSASAAAAAWLRRWAEAARGGRRMSKRRSRDVFDCQRDPRLLEDSQTPLEAGLQTRVRPCVLHDNLRVI